MGQQIGPDHTCQGSGHVIHQLIRQSDTISSKSVCKNNEKKSHCLETGLLLLACHICSLYWSDHFRLACILLHTLAPNNVFRFPNRTIKLTLTYNTFMIFDTFLQASDSAFVCHAVLSCENFRKSSHINVIPVEVAAIKNQNRSIKRQSWHLGVFTTVFISKTSLFVTS